MKKLIVAAVFPCAAIAGDFKLMNDDGATCVIPDGWNAGPYQDTYNRRGMGEFCEWPQKPITDSLLLLIEQCKADTLPDLPECSGDDSLVVSPGQPDRPCYRVFN